MHVHGVWSMEYGYCGSWYGMVWWYGISFPNIPSELLTELISKRSYLRRNYCVARDIFIAPGGGVRGDNRTKER